MTVGHYTYRVLWSQEDAEYIGLCAQLPSLSWLAATPEDALSGIHQLTAEAIADIHANGETVPH
jgi:predicted RNase H-like HicB family nuclease